MIKPRIRHGSRGYRVLLEGAMTSNPMHNVYLMTDGSTVECTQGVAERAYSMPREVAENAINLYMGHSDEWDDHE